MITTFIGVSVRFWMYAGDPDNDVHTSGGAYADIGEFFMNTGTGALFICTNGGVAIQTWQSTTNINVVLNLIAAIPQANWTQATPTSSDYIKNKPSIPSAQIQSDWTQGSSGSLDFIKNKPSIPSTQIQSDWTQASTGSLDY